MTEKDFLERAEIIYQQFINHESVKAGWSGDAIGEMLSHELFSLLLEFKEGEE